jgi:predicted nucleic acid-binding protein
VKYWDSSALVPLLVQQDVTDSMRAILRDDPAIVTWWGTPVECASALARLHREGELEADSLSAAMSRLRSATSMWTEVAPLPDVREQSIRIVRVHGLRAADALQLAAAIVACDFEPGTLEFVSLDDRQRIAAEHEGFSVSTR